MFFFSVIGAIQMRYDDDDVDGYVGRGKEKGGKRVRDEKERKWKGERTRGQGGVEVGER